MMNDLVGHIAEFFAVDPVGNEAHCRLCRDAMKSAWARGAAVCSDAIQNGILLGDVMDYWPTDSAEIVKNLSE